MSLTSSDKTEGPAIALQSVERWGRRRKRVGLAAFPSQSNSFVNAVAAPAPGGEIIGILMFSNVVFNLTDMATTFAALGSGFGEGNSLLLAMSAALGLSVFMSLVVMKAIFVTGAIVIAVIGMRSGSKTTRNLALCYLLASTLVFYSVSLNNIFWIVK